MDFSYGDVLLEYLEPVILQKLQKDTWLNKVRKLIKNINISLILNSIIEIIPPVVIEVLLDLDYPLLIDGVWFVELF